MITPRPCSAGSRCCRAGASISPRPTERVSDDAAMAGSEGRGGVPGIPAKAAGRPEVRRRLSAARRRALILKGAARVFAERGYSGASMTDIADASGVAASVIYDHFASKRGLHLELLNQHARAMVEATTMMRT